MQPRLTQKFVATRYLDFYSAQAVAAQNVFRKRVPDRTRPPGFRQSRGLLPEPFGEGLETAIGAYWKTWELAFKNLQRVTRGNGFVSPYIDTAFNDNLFMWDSAFILMFARYGSRAFSFQRTLDNFYAKQHDDGFICREIRESDGQDQFHRYDPASTGPNILPWCEWEYFCNFGDRRRLAEVFTPLLAYYRWTRTWRSWPDGSYWSSGFGCGMDNQPRTPPDANPYVDHGFMGWIDATAQAVLSGRILLAMAKVLGRTRDAEDVKTEVRTLAAYVNRYMWDKTSRFYGDRLRDGRVSPVKSIGGYWTLLAGLVPAGRLKSFVGHLEDPAKFKRTHRVPTLSADDPGFVPKGAYWRGAVWPPTNYMVLRGLTLTGRDDLAHAIGLNHVQAVARVFKNTGTVWENYAADFIIPGSPAKADFVGWGGLGPVAVLMEYVLGLRPDVPRGKLVWDVRLTQKHGVRKYPYGAAGIVDLSAEARARVTDPPIVSIRSSVALTVELLWPGGRRVLRIAGQH